MDTGSKTNLEVINYLRSVGFGAYESDQSQPISNTDDIETIFLKLDYQKELKKQFVGSYSSESYLEFFLKLQEIRNASPSLLPDLSPDLLEFSSKLSLDIQEIPNRGDQDNKSLMGEPIMLEEEFKTFKLTDRQELAEFIKKISQPEITGNYIHVTVDNYFDDDDPRINPFLNCKQKKAEIKIFVENDTDASGNVAKKITQYVSPVAKLRHNTQHIDVTQYNQLSGFIEALEQYLLSLDESDEKTKYQNALANLKIGVASQDVIDFLKEFKTHDSSKSNLSEKIALSALAEGQDISNLFLFLKQSFLQHKIQEVVLAVKKYIDEKKITDEKIDEINNLIGNFEFSLGIKTTRQANGKITVTRYTEKGNNQVENSQYLDIRDQNLPQSKFKLPLLARIHFDDDGTIDGAKIDNSLIYYFHNGVKKIIDPDQVETINEYLRNCGNVEPLGRRDEPVVITSLKDALKNIIKNTTVRVYTKDLQTNQIQCAEKKFLNQSDLNHLDHVSRENDPGQSYRVRRAPELKPEGGGNAALGGNAFNNPANFGSGEEYVSPALSPSQAQAPASALVSDPASASDPASTLVSDPASASAPASALVSASDSAQASDLASASDRAGASAQDQALASPPAPAPAPDRAGALSPSTLLVVEGDISGNAGQNVAPPPPPSPPPPPPPPTRAANLPYDMARRSPANDSLSADELDKGAEQEISVLNKAEMQGGTSDYERFRRIFCNPKPISSEVIGQAHQAQSGVRQGSSVLNEAEMQGGTSDFERLHSIFHNTKPISSEVISQVRQPQSGVGQESSVLNEAEMQGNPSYFDFFSGIFGVRQGSSQVSYGHPSSSQFGLRLPPPEDRDIYESVDLRDPNDGGSVASGDEEEEREREGAISFVSEPQEVSGGLYGQSRTGWQYGSPAASIAEQIGRGANSLPVPASLDTIRGLLDGSRTVVLPYGSPAALGALGGGGFDGSRTVSSSSYSLAAAARIEEQRGGVANSSSVPVSLLALGGRFNGSRTGGLPYHSSATLEASTVLHDESRTGGFPDHSPAPTGGAGLGSVGKPRIPGQPTERAYV